MDEEIERLLVSVRADTGAFARDVADMRGQLEGPLATGVDRAGRVLENSLVRALSSGKLGFEDLKRVALSAMSEIAAGAIRGGLNSLVPGGGAGLMGTAMSLIGGLLGAPGQATGGPVSPGRAYMVGERGPELFVPTSSGRVEANGRGGARDVRMNITINSQGGDQPAAFARSSRQVARAVKAALMREDD